MDNADEAEKNAEAQFEQVKARKVSAEANVQTALASVTAAAGDVATSKANIERAQVSLGYCQIHALCDGRVTERTVDVGNYVTVGEAMFMLVSPMVTALPNDSLNLPQRHVLSSRMFKSVPPNVMLVND